MTRRLACALIDVLIAPTGALIDMIGTGCESAAVVCEETAQTLRWLHTLTRACP